VTIARAEVEPKARQDVELTKVLEAFMSRLSSLLLGRKVVALAKIVKSSFNTDRDWMFFSWGGSESAFSFDRVIKPQNQIASLSNMLTVAALCEDGQLYRLSGQMPQIIPGFSVYSPLYEKEFTLYDLRQRGEPLGSVYYAGKADVFPVNSREDSHYIELMRVKRQKKTRQLSLTVDSYMHDTEALMKKKECLFPNYEARLSNEEATYAIDIQTSSNNLIFITKDCLMSNIEGSDSVKLSLSLGDIELSEQDYLNLRAGSNIEISNTESFQGLLQIEGQTVARAEVRIEEGGLRVQIIDFE